MSKAKGKYQISFVNGGKPFDIEKWTVKKHKFVLKEMAKYEKAHEGITEEQKDDKFQEVLIVHGLKDVDENITSENLDEMHPNDKKALFTAIFFAGREGIVATSKPKKGDDANFPSQVQT